MQQFRNEYASATDKVLYKMGANNKLKGFDTSFSNMHIPMIDNNKNLFNDKTYLKHNIIPNQEAYPGVTYPERDTKPKFIPRQYKIILHSGNKSSGTHGNYTINLHEPIKNITSARLLNAILYDTDSDYTGNDSGRFTKPTDFITLHIDQFGKNVGTTSGIAGLGDKLNDSFAVLNYRGRNDVNGDLVDYHNEYRTNMDIKYFDPPLKSLNNIKVRLYDTSGNDIGDNIINKFELLIETIEKIRIYT